MSDVLNEAYRIVQCKECPWYKQCVTPMKFTAEDIRRQMENQNPSAGQSGSWDMSMQNLLSNMASAAQNSLLEACPVFIEQVRCSPELALKLKRLMQNWGTEEKKE